jgi:3-oxoacyl-[acyl-carrier-protein] synthase III
VLKGIQEGLKLPAAAMIPSFAALRDYGNTSCSTTWYVLAYTESCGDVRPGDVLLQVRARAPRAPCAAGRCRALCAAPALAGRAGG